MKNKICVYAITKNEEQFVERWYESMKEADSIVVLDTGSTDKTVEKLRSLGVTVEVKIYNPWRFDTPRNDAMKMAPDDCNILLSTDLDEVLEPGWADIIRENWIEGKHSRCTYRYVWSHLDDGGEGRVFGYNKCHNRDWEWRYPVHELLWNKNTQSELYPTEESLDLFDKITLHHYPDQSKSRASYLPLLELREREYKEDWYGLIYLAHEYYYNSMYEQSINKLKYILAEFKDKYSTLEESSCYLFMGDSYKELGDSINAIQSYLNAIKVDETYREPYINLAKVLIENKDYEMARVYLIKALKKTFRHFTWLERDTSWTYELFDLLAQACFYSDHKLESIAYAAKAYKMCISDERLRDNLEVCLAMTSDKELYV